ncbi:MAG: hypothetical protein IT373_27960 [Polyangiaceae bacterium]|nr:hypothetical protein [Polyangiaceae bacterium]
MRNGWKLLVSAAALSLLGGCVRYQVLAASDQGDERRKNPGTLPVTQLETLKTTNYYFVITIEHQFWLCQDSGDTLLCDRRCGSGTDLECPALSAGGGTITSNVR